jgi:predicted nuclease with TOPRIM domain
MSREEKLEAEIGEIQERLEKAPKDTSEEEVSWLKQKLEELSVKLDKFYVKN